MGENSNKRQGRVMARRKSALAEGGCSVWSMMVVAVPSFLAFLRSSTGAYVSRSQMNETDSVTAGAMTMTHISHLQL